MAEANKQLKRVDNITRDVEQVTTNISSLIAVFTASIGGPLTKLFGVVQGAAKVFGKRR
jgi:tetrahydromethanopterin S-methyltransferase subunit G